MLQNPDPKPDLNPDLNPTPKPDLNTDLDLRWICTGSAWDLHGICTGPALDLHGSARKLHGICMEIGIENGI